MKKAQFYQEVGADVLRDHGIIDTIRTPIDGVDRHADIPWDRVSRLTVSAMRIVDTEELTSFPHSYLTVHFRDEKPRAVDFSLKSQDDDIFAVSTVAGTQVGQVELGHEASTIIGHLLQLSLQSGEVRR